MLFGRALGALSGATTSGRTRDGKIGVWLAAMLVAGNMMGSSVYLLPTVLAKSGGISVLGWAAATAGALFLLVFGTAQDGFSKLSEQQRNAQRRRRRSPI